VTFMRICWSECNVHACYNHYVTWNVVMLQWAGGQPCGLPGEKRADQHSAHRHAAATYDQLTLHMLHIDPYCNWWRLPHHLQHLSSSFSPHSLPTQKTCNMIRIHMSDIFWSTAPNINTLVTGLMFFVLILFLLHKVLNVQDFFILQWQWGFGGVFTMSKHCHHKAVFVTLQVQS